MKFKFIEHTADIKFQAFGKSLETCFANAALALTNIICKNKIKSVIRKTIKIKGKDKESLLYNFLEEFLFLSETEGFILSNVESIKINTKNELIAIVFFDHAKEEKQGKKIKKKYELETHVKAITYSDMFIRQEKIKNKTKKTWICQVVVDV